MRPTFRRLLVARAIPIVLLIAGTMGYDVIEGWSSFDALHVTVITLTTVGFAEASTGEGFGVEFEMHFRALPR